MKNFYLMAITAIVTASITWNISTEAFIGQVRDNTKDVAYLKEELGDCRAQVESDRIEFQNRQKSISELVQDNLKASTELIQLIKLQQQIGK